MPAASLAAGATVVNVWSAPTTWPAAVVTTTRNRTVVPGFRTTKQGADRLRAGSGRETLHGACSAPRQSRRRARKPPGPLRHRYRSTRAAWRSSSSPRCYSGTDNRRRRGVRRATPGRAEEEQGCRRSRRPCRREPRCRGRGSRRETQEERLTGGWFWSCVGVAHCREYAPSLLEWQVLNSIFTSASPMLRAIRSPLTGSAASLGM